MSVASLNRLNAEVTAYPWCFLISNHVAAMTDWITTLNL
jgi:hypothetical protein